MGGPLQVPPSRASALFHVVPVLEAYRTPASAKKTLANESFEPPRGLDDASVPAPILPSSARRKHLCGA